MSPRRSTFTARLAARAARRPLLTVALWLCAAVAAVAAFLAWGDALTATDDFLTTPESRRVERVVAGRLPGGDADTEVVVVSSRTRSLGDADGAFARHVAELAARLEAVGGHDVAGVVSIAAVAGDVSSLGGEAAAEAAAQLVSEDGRTTLILVTLAGDASAADDHVDAIYDLVRAEDGRGGYRVAMMGAATWQHEARALAESDLRRGELIGVPIALAILLIVFGAVAATLVPLLLAGVAIALALALTVAMGAWFDVSVFAVNIVTMMGLAVGIDYSLLIVSRYREERGAGRDVTGAIAAAAATASRAVFFSGGTVVLALTGMLIVPYTVFTSLGAGSIFVVVAAVTAALALLPAVLRLLGDRIGWGRIRLPGRRTVAGGDPDGFWTRAARVMMRRPLIALLTGCAALALCAVPLAGMKTGVAGAREFPPSTSSRQAYDLMRGSFSVGMSSPIVVTLAGELADPEVTAAAERLQAAAAADGRFRAVGFQTDGSGELAVLKLAVDADPSSGAAMDAVRDLRRELAPAAARDAPVEILVGGVPGLYTDVIDMIDAYTPWVIGAVLALSFVLLLVAFRSLVVAVQAILMNLLSVGAAYGLVTLIFQHGVGAGLLGFTQVERILAWLPLLMFCVLFGLSMDYHIFLLSRIRERYDACGDTREAVVFGVGSTAGIITGTALIMVAVFAGVAMGDMTMFQQLGFGLAVAIAIDATIVRTVIVPAAMTLLGHRCWYLPRWLGWLPAARFDAGRK